MPKVKMWAVSSCGDVSLALKTGNIYYLEEEAETRRIWFRRTHYMDAKIIPVTVTWAEPGKKKKGK
jgi:hypothetical protein